MILLIASLSVPSPGQCGGKTGAELPEGTGTASFSTLSGSMWWKNPTLAAEHRSSYDFQYPLRVNVVEKLIHQRGKRPRIELSVPSPGQCGGKTVATRPLTRPFSNFQYPLRVNVVEKPFTSSNTTPPGPTFSTLSGSMWWKNFRCARCPFAAPDLSVPSPGQCGGKTPGNFQERGPADPFSTLSGSMWWKNLPTIHLTIRPSRLSVPSPGQCGGKTML